MEKKGDTLTERMDIHDFISRDRNTQFIILKR